MLLLTLVHIIVNDYVDISFLVNQVNLVNPSKTEQTSYLACLFRLIIKRHPTTLLPTVQLATIYELANFPVVGFSCGGKFYHS